jgi:hypothetical protein
MSLSKLEKLQNNAPNDTVGVANVSGVKTSDPELSLKGRLPLIKCECGTEILLLPDLKAMDRAIDAHVAEHREKGKILPEQQLPVI